MQTRVGVSAIRALESIKGGSCLDGISLVGGQGQRVPGLLERSYVVLVPRFAGPVLGLVACLDLSSSSAYSELWP